MVRAWARPSSAGGSDVDGTLEPISAHAAWQPELWRLLRAEIDTPSPPERMTGVLDLVRSGRLGLDLPDRLLLFGFTSLPGRDFLPLVEALAATRQVRLFLLEPHRFGPAGLVGTWPTPPGGRPRLRSDDPTGSSLHHPLLRSWGRLPRESALLLGDRMAAGPVHLTTVAAPGAEPTTVLGRLQADIRDDTVSPPAPRAPDDRSVRFHACFGPMRQVQVARDAILHLLADAGGGLAEEDVLVVCPDLERFAPLVEAVFGPTGGPSAASGDGAPPLRYRIADRSIRSANPVMGATAALLDLVAGRFEISEVLDFVSLAPVRTRFGFDDADLAVLAEWAAGTRVRWGLDPDHRAGFGVPATVVANTWQAALDRLLLGSAVADTELELAIGGIAPFGVDGGDLELLGAFARILECLAGLADRGLARRPDHRGMDGPAATDVRGPPRDPRRVRLAVRRPRAGPGGDRGRCGRLGPGGCRPPRPARRPPPPRAAPGQRARAARLLPRGRHGHLDGLAPVGPVPCGVRARTRPGRARLLGPGRRGPGGGRTAGRRPRPACRVPSVAARGGARRRRPPDRGPRGSGRPIEPCGAPGRPGGRAVRGGDGPRRRAGRGPPVRRAEVAHPRHPFDEACLVPGELAPSVPWTFAPRDLRGAERRRSRPVRRVPFLDERLDDPVGATVELEALHEFLRDPVATFVRRSLEAGLPRPAEEVDDVLPVEPDGLEMHRIGQQLLDARLQGTPDDRWRRAERAKGALPPGVLEDRLFEDLATEIDGLLAEAERRGVRGGEPDLYAVDVTDADGVRIVGTVPLALDGPGPGPGRVQFTRPKDTHRLGAWLDLLVLVASEPEVPWRSVVVTRAKGKDAKLAPVELRPASEDDPGAMARRELALVVDLYRRGLRGPLPLFPSYSAALHAGGSPDSGWRDHLGRGDATAPAVRLVFGDVDVEEIDDLPARSWDPAGPGSRVERYARHLWGAVDRSSVVVR